MSELSPSGSQYTDEERREAAVQYAVKGVMSVVSRSLDIPETTLSQWKQTDWWDTIIVEIRSANSDQHIAQYNRLTEKALALAERGIDQLDPNALKANDIKALVVTGATSTDKGLLLDGKPTHISSSQGDMTVLADTFRKLYSDHKAKQDKIVSEQ